jgi:hypothetical protein
MCCRPTIVYANEVLDDTSLPNVFTLKGSGGMHQPHSTLVPHVLYGQDTAVQQFK